jgi:hypothetical protein
MGTICGDMMYCVYIMIKFFFGIEDVPQYNEDLF